MGIKMQTIFTFSKFKLIQEVRNKKDHKCLKITIFLLLDQESAETFTLIFYYIGIRDIRFMGIFFSKKHTNFQGIQMGFNLRYSGYGGM